ncbi:MAG: radical SAM protein [Nitrospinae bacterium]|nr:radical SAM protein [Nitrospinota bacterium]
MSFETYVISWNLTKRCNLKCSHCYLDAEFLNGTGRDTLSTQDCFKIIDQLAEVNPHAILILTGGEPLVREDIYDISSYAEKKGFMVVLGTNGLLLSEKVCKKLSENGISGIGISLDSITPDYHDQFRGYEGAWQKTVNNIDNIKKAGIDFQIQMTVTKENRNQLELMAKFAHEKGARVFNIFFLVCTGRGEDVSDLSAEEYEETLTQIYHFHDKFEGMMVRPKCAPHFKRITHEIDPQSPLLKGYVGGCRAGTNYCRINSEGIVTPCPYMETETGNLLKDSFKNVWEESPLFLEMRKAKYSGKCDICDYSLMCGGCRARALATNGNIMGEDPWCSYLPALEAKDKVVNIPTTIQFGLEEVFPEKKNEEIKEVSWHPEAEKMLAKIPFFARGIAKRGMEDYAKTEGKTIITPEDMEFVRKKMTRSFGRKS